MNRLKKKNVSSRKKW